MSLPSTLVQYQSQLFPLGDVAFGERGGEQGQIAQAELWQELFLEHEHAGQLVLGDGLDERTILRRCVSAGSMRDIVFTACDSHPRYAAAVAGILILEAGRR
jgi:hypothetical protein